MPLKQDKLLVLVFLGFLLWTRPAYAIIPQLIGPFQAFLSILPQIALLLLGFLGALFSFRYWRAWAQARLEWLNTRRRKVVAIFCILTFTVTLMALAAHLSVGPNTPPGPADPPSPPPPPPQPSQTPQAQAADWPIFRSNSSRTGTIDGLPGPTQPVARWVFRDPESRIGDFSSSPAVVGDRVYFGGASASVFVRTGSIYCLDAHTGRLIWRTPTTQEVFSSPCVAEGRVYVGEGLHQNTGSRMRCLDALTGRVLWEFEVESHAEGSPTVSEQRVYFGAGDDGLYCLDALTGEMIWHLPGYHIDASPVVAGRVLYVGTGYTRPTFLALDAHTGKVIWKKDLETSAWGDPALSGDLVFFGISNVSLGTEQGEPLGKVLCLDARTGEERWSFRAGHGIGASLVADGEDLFCASWDHKVYGLDPATGRKRWETDVGDIVFSSPAVDAQHLYVATHSGRLLCLGRATGQIQWTLGLEEWIEDEKQFLASPALAGGRIYIGAAANLFLCLGDRAPDAP